MIKKQRTSTIIAAAYSLGVREDILESVLPILRTLSVAANESDKEGTWIGNIQKVSPMLESTDQLSDIDKAYKKWLKNG